MPLLPGKSPAAISSNISELTHHGSRPRSHKQIVAIALSNARKTARADGGSAQTEEEIARRDLQEHGGLALGVTRLEHSNPNADPRMNRLSQARDTRTGDTFLTVNPEEHEQQGNPVWRERFAKGGAALAAKAYRLARSMAKEQEAASDEKDRHFDLGGTPEMPPFVKSEMIQMQRGNNHPPGLVQGAGPGRTDTVSTSVPSGSYILPADVISGLGQGNSGYGADVMSRILSSGPHGITMPRMRGGHSNMPHPPAPYREPPIEIPGAPKGFADGGEAEPIDVKLASGEFVLHPHQVKMFGGGDVDRGHRILDRFVLAVRKKAIDEQKKLPGPKKAHEI